jgi:O-antigen/teichoic acid export membrane protein
MAMCCAAGAQLAIDILAGAEGQPSVEVLRIQGLTLVATGLAVAAGYGLLTLRRYRAMLWTNAVALAGSVVLTLVLVDPLGAKGAAIATLGAESLMAVGMVVALLRARPGLASALTGAPLILGVAGAGTAVALLTGMPSIVGLVVANVVFVGGLVVVRRFPPEVKDVLRRA